MSIPRDRPIEAYLRRRDDGSTWTPDAAVQLTVSRQPSVTSHPIEEGIDVADHVQPQPRRITATLVVTENPKTGLGGPARIRQRLAWLEQTGNEARPVDIVTRRHGVFLRYAMSSISFPINGVASARFELEFTEIRVATVSTIQVSVESANAGTDGDDLATGAPDEVDQGEQATTDTGSDSQTEQEAENDSSLLADLVDYVSG